MYAHVYVYSYCKYTCLHVFMCVYSTLSAFLQISLVVSAYNFLFVCVRTHVCVLYVCVHMFFTEISLFVRGSFI